jgi:hypothetical protein
MYHFLDNDHLRDSIVRWTVSKKALTEEIALNLWAEKSALAGGLLAKAQDLGGAR